MRLLPPAARKIVHDMYEEGVFPSPATMSRSSLFVDVAFMRILADRHAQYVTVQCLFFTLSDGSPQNGRLCQITEYYCVGQFEGDFDEVGAAACRLRCFPKDPALITADMLAEMVTLMIVVRAGKIHHVFAPMCMDSRNSGLPTKGHCVVQQVRVESHDWNLTAAMIALFFSMTGDRGPEASLNTVYLPNLDTFSYWRPPRVDAAEDLLQVDDEPSDPIISMKKALDISGIYHSIHLIEDRLLKVLKCYGEIKKDFESLVITFHRPWTRKRFKRTVPKEQQCLFTTGPPLLEGGRAWTVTQEAVKYFKTREAIIRDNWDGGVVSGNKNPEEEDGEGDEPDDLFKDTSVHVGRCNRCIKMAFFWATLGLVQVFGDWLGNVVNWCLGCACHPRRLREAFGLHVDVLKCPCRTCRAPCIAAGRLDGVMARLSQLSFQQIDGITDPELTVVDRSRLIDEFYLGREFVDTEHQIRNYGWKRAPLKGLVLGDWDLNVIIDKLIEMLAEFEAVSEANYPDCHMFTLDLFARGGPLREQVLTKIICHKKKVAHNENIWST